MARKAYSEREREQVKETLQTTVIQCIVDRGLIHSSIDVLCKKVGISKAFFYTFFPSKEELVLEALRYQQPKLLQYARHLMEDPSLSWREGVEAFLKNCCYGAKSGVAVLSIEEEQQVRHCLSEENFQAFRQDQVIFYGKLLSIFGLPADSIDPRLFGNLALAMMMVYKAIPDTMPFLFPEVAEDMVEFQVKALVDEMERMQKLLVQAKEEKYYELFLLELATGLRLGEIAALQWDDLNLETGELRINKQAGTSGPDVVICEPKTKAAVRTLILPPSVLKVMREYRARVNSRWMFPSPKKEDSPMRPSSIHQRLHRILDHAGCDRVRFHDLRHTFATNALSYGMDIKTLSTILGHVSCATTLNTYSHVTDEMRQQAAVKIDRGIAKAEVTEQEEKPKERTMTTFQVRKRWSRMAS